MLFATKVASTKSHDELMLLATRVASTKSHDERMLLASKVGSTKSHDERMLFATKVARTNIPKSYFRSFDVTSLANHREGWQHVIGLRHAGEGIPGACNREEGDLCHATNDFEATATKDALERGLWMFRNSTVTSQVCDVLLRLRRLTAS